MPPYEVYKLYVSS